ncbi:RNA polymerase II degradation factor 1-like [Drosophila mojavensis]|uniref:RNA polymerase II degradation factor 1-like n=1 Tax=Drosophila mojavensis TaxID=7230 RepID=UPI001CD1778E|nr:RNA polymerase II degradation factor 1-like [Drosophila mojavensis]
MAMTIKQHLCNANAVKQPQMPQQQQQQQWKQPQMPLQQQQRKQPQMPQQQQQSIKVNKLPKQKLPQQPLKNVKPYPKKQSQSTLLSYADALKANHHPVQLNQPIARQQPQPQEGLRRKLPYEDVSTDAATKYKYESRQHKNVNTSTDQKLDILISLMLEERKRPAAPVVNNNSNNSSSNLEEKIDKLINMIGLLATHLMKDNRIK